MEPRIQYAQTKDGAAVRSDRPMTITMTKALRGHRTWRVRGEAGIEASGGQIVR